MEKELIKKKKKMDQDDDEKQEEDGSTVDGERWVYDSSFDHKGRVPFRASTGVWKASLFIIAIEFSERLSYFGIATSLIIYLTKVIQQDLKTAAKSVNYWSGVTTTMPLLGGFLADAYLGRFSTVLVSSCLYILGLLLLTLSRVIPALKPCENDSSSTCPEVRKIHVVIFFLGIYLVSVGTGGHKPCLESFGADQFDEDHPEERKKKMSFFNWWNFGLCCGLLLGVTLIVYIQEHVSWAMADIVLTIVMAATILIFCLGRPFYRYRRTMGSPFTPMLRVIIAAISKRNLPYPSNPVRDLYEIPRSEQRQGQGRLLCHTDRLKFLDKAAIFVDEKEIINTKKHSWTLTTVTRVEELKLIINMIPIWLTTLPFGICVAQAATFFIKQCTTLNRNVFANDFQIPPASIYALAAIGMIISVTMYEKILVHFLRSITGQERGLKILQRIGIGMVFSSVTMITAALVERKRLGIVKQNPVQGSMSMSVFWLAPQFIIIGMGDGFTLVGLQEYFYDQVPDSMRSIGIALYLSVMGAANFLSSLLITVVDNLTEKDGKSWIGKDLNSSRLDCFYWLLAAMNTANIGIFVLVARRYSYKNVQTRLTTRVVADCYHQQGKDDELMETGP